jgi:GT2 family glycosyltransferase
VSPSPFQASDVSVAIPTYERGVVLLETLRAVMAQCPGEIVVIDQTPAHPPDVQVSLEALELEGRFRWERLSPPAIPPAMNAGLLRATRPLVLFLDDDIVPAPGLVAAHTAAYEDEATWAVAGQVLQPGEEPSPARPCRTHGFRAHLDFVFRSCERALVTNGMAGNLSVRRERALAVGGFDENFEGAAYRFETEFCRRLCRAGGTILFEPAASIKHLRAPRGGTRMLGGHLTSASAAYGVGDYYFALRGEGGAERWAYLACRPFREVATRFHLRRPWFIPVKLLGELRALLRASQLVRRSPRLLRPPA